MVLLSLSLSLTHTHTHTNTHTHTHTHTQNVPLSTELPSTYLLSHFSSQNGSYHFVKALKKGVATLHSTLSKIKVNIRSSLIYRNKTVFILITEFGSFVAIAIEVHINFMLYS